MNATEQYAQALFELDRKLESFGPSSGTMGKLADNFVAILKRRGHERLLGAVVRRLEEKIAQDEKRGAIELVVAKTADSERYAHEFESHAKVFGGHVRVTAVRVDDRIIGGYVLHGRGTRVDASYRRQLLDLYGFLTK